MICRFPYMLARSRARSWVWNNSFLAKQRRIARHPRKVFFLYHRDSRQRSIPSYIQRPDNHRLTSHRFQQAADMLGPIFLHLAQLHAFGALNFGQSCKQLDHINCKKALKSDDFKAFLNNYCCPVIFKIKLQVAFLLPISQCAFFDQFFVSSSPVATISAPVPQISLIMTS